MKSSDSMNSKTGFENIESVYPLSPAQQGILFHSLYAQETQVYFSQLNCSLAEDLDCAAFERAWEALVARHPIFRTAFVWEEVSEPLQVVGRNVTLPLKKYDWRSRNKQNQEQSLREFLAEDRERGFDLSQAPLMRLSLIQLADQLYHFTWSSHHILLDGWSQSLVLRDIFALYEAQLRGEEIAEAKPRPYRDYIAWLRRQDLGPAASFWRRTLGGFRAPTPLPFERRAGRRGVGAGKYHQQHTSLSSEDTVELNAFARRQRVTLNTLAQGAWALLLSRVSGERDVVFGAVVSGRPAELAGVEEMVGVFINTLPVRVGVSGEQRVGEWLRELQEQQAEMRQYEHSPLVEVQGWSEVPRSLPLFESILDFKNYSLIKSTGQASNTRTSGDFGFIARTNYPLELVVQSGSELHLYLTYDRQRLDDEAAGRVIKYVETLLMKIASDPNQKLSELSWLTEAEHDRLIVEWNETTSSYPRDKLMHQLFEEQVTKNPEAVAVVYRSESLSYGELNRQANRLARSLRGLGIKSDVVVPLLAERKPDFLTAVLGIFKAGGAYMPLDPHYPANRLKLILSQSKPTLVLTESRFVPALKEAVADLPKEKMPRLLMIEELVNSEQEDNHPEVSCAPRNLAYVIYTSGSTGKPKGAMLEHQGMLNHLCAKIAELELTQDDVVAQTASQCFDISVWQFLAPLVAGARLHIIDNEVVHDPRRLLDLLESQAISIFESVPSLLPAIFEAIKLSEGKNWSLSRLRWLIMTGETLPPDLCRRWLQCFPRVPLLNAYGPTECSDDVTHHRVYQPPPDDVDRVSIGRALMNTRLYVLDPEMRPVPIGAAGELYVGGDGVGRGYLDDPKRTAEVFVPDPFTNARGGRLYRTGDIARYSLSGELECLGRSDYQVKLRGFRIELGEIEIILRQHAAVRDCVVVVSDQRLAAYLVVDRNQPDLVIQLRNYVKERLPDYMIPATFMILESLPLSANGKVDRRALPAPDALPGESAVASVPPETPTQEALAEIWAESLRMERPGIDDNFFDLGGHSLLATQVVSRIRVKFGVDLPLMDFFAAATIRAMSEKIETVLLESASAEKIDQLLEQVEAIDEYETGKAAQPPLSPTTA